MSVKTSLNITEFLSGNLVTDHNKAKNKTMNAEHLAEGFRMCMSTNFLLCASMETDSGFVIALEQARKSASEGGVPIGAALVGADGSILGRGHNMRVQKGSAILHVSGTLPSIPYTRYTGQQARSKSQAEMSCLENSGRLPASKYHGATMYTTLSPCDMCTGACLLYKIKRVVIGENATFVGGENYLKQRGVEVININSKACQDLMSKFLSEKPELWNEDISV